MISEELPEHQIFHILKRGEQEPIGPYSQIQIGQLLNAGQIRASDYVYYPELSGWQVISRVFELHQQLNSFGDEGQDPRIVDDSFALVDSRSGSEENIYYIAVQHIPLLKVTAAVTLTGPKSIVLTDHRIWVITPKVMGDTDFEEYDHNQIERVMKRLPQNQADGTFIIALRSGDWIETGKIPGPQLERLEQIASDFIEQADEEQAV
jgi:hypothetical protein